MGPFEVLSPVAPADPPPARRIQQRLSSLVHRRIGLFLNDKRAAPLIQTYVERELKNRFPGIHCSRFEFPHNGFIVDYPEPWARFQQWLQGVDAVIGAVGD